MVILREVLSRPKNSNSDPTQNTAQSQNYKENWNVIRIKT